MTYEYQVSLDRGRTFRSVAVGLTADDVAKIIVRFDLSDPTRTRFAPTR